MKRVLIFCVVCVFMAAPAIADIASNEVLYHSGSTLYGIPDVTDTIGSSFNNEYTIGTFNTELHDIAYDWSNGTLYGIRDELYTIDMSTGAATLFWDSPTANALSNYGPDLFYAADYFTGNFYSIDVSGAPSSTLIGSYSDGTTSYVSAGDIWVADDGTVYATIRTSTAGYLATVNTATAQVTIVAPIPGTGPTDLYGLTENSLGELLVWQSNKNVLKLSGNSLVDTGIDTGYTVFGASTVPIPGAVLLGILGLGVAGWKLRKYA